MQPIDLKCEFLREPLAVGAIRPRFSWRLSTCPSNWMRRAYQVQVTAISHKAALKTVWDSGIVEDVGSTYAVYGGPILAPNEDFIWRVKEWGASGAESEWSDDARFSTALAGVAQWYGSFSGAPTTAERDPRAPFRLRRRFDLPNEPVTRARLHFTARGLIVPYVNSSRASDSVLSPGWTDYGKRLAYEAVDVAALLKPGSNVIGAWLASGWYAGHVCWFGPGQYGPSPEGLMRLCIEYADHEPVVVSTGSDEWRCFGGSIVESDILHGERALLGTEDDRWLEPDFDDGEWWPAAPRPIGAAELVPRTSRPVRRIEEITPCAIHECADSFLADYGQNVAGRVRTFLPPNAKVRIRHGEVLDDSGALYIENLRAARAVDAAENLGSAQLWEPEFTFHGFRYAEFTGAGAEEAARSSSAVVLHSELDRTGWFECSNPLLNQLFENAVWSTKGNFLDVPTDCPQRDERLGWTGDAQVFAYTAAYLFDVSAFFAKWMIDVCDGVDRHGRFPNIAPQMQHLGQGAPGWGEAGILVPATMQLFFGDDRIVSESEGAMARHLRAILDANPDGIWRRGRSHDFGDWLAPVHETDKGYLATAYLIASLDRFKSMSPNRHLDLAEACSRCRGAFQKEYFVENLPRYATQTAHALALSFGLVEEEHRAACADALEACIETENGHVGVGFLGVEHLLPSLASEGRFDRCYQLLSNRTCPSWLYAVDQGATTIWERWDGWTAEKGFQDPGMNSFNHYAYGSVVRWFFEHIGGIRPTRPAFRSFVLSPTPGGGLEWSKTRFDSRYGTIRSEWTIDGSRWDWTAEIPPGCEAEVVLPPGMGFEIEVDGRREEWARFELCRSQRCSRTFGSGTYTISSRLENETV